MVYICPINFNRIRFFLSFIRNNYWNYISYISVSNILYIFLDFLLGIRISLVFVFMEIFMSISKKRRKIIIMDIISFWII